MTLVPPLDGLIRVTDRFGTVRANDDGTTWQHGGIDLVRMDGDSWDAPIQSPEAGIVVATWDVTKPEGGWPYGNAVAVRGYGQGHTSWRFLHLHHPTTLRVNQEVEAGQTVGLMGSSGNSTGVHLHLDATPNGQMRPSNFDCRGARVDPLLLYAQSYALAVGYAPEVMVQQVTHESGWNPPAGSRVEARGIAQIIEKWHPTMVGKTFDPFASLRYMADLMSAHISRRDGSYRAALADYNTGRWSTGSFRGQGYHYADLILRSTNMATVSEFEAIRVDRDRNHKQKMKSLFWLGELIAACNRIPASAFHSPADQKIHQEAERFYHNPTAE